MFSSIQEAWGSSFQETREMFKASNIPHYMKHPNNQAAPKQVEHFCPGCMKRASTTTEHFAAPTCNDTIVQAGLFGLLVLIALHLLENKS